MLAVEQSINECKSSKIFSIIFCLACIWSKSKSLAVTAPVNLNLSILQHYLYDV